jgi:hypothetical protein
MLKSQDERMIKDYDGDINALLVFVRQLYAQFDVFVLITIKTC